MFYEDSDYQYCLTQLKKAVDQFRCRLHAFVLTPENIQVLLSSQNNSCVVKAVELLEQEYMQHFNATYRRIHRTLDLDYSMVPVDEEQHLLKFHKYIEMVPVRVRLVDHPADYPWSSFTGNAMGENTGLLCPHQKYMALGRDDHERQSRYRDLFTGFYPSDTRQYFSSTL